jgi:hypothetical protein
MRSGERSGSNVCRCCKGANLILIWIAALALQLILLNVFVAHHQHHDDPNTTNAFEVMTRSVPQPGRGDSSSKRTNQNPDGYFNGYPIYLYEPKPKEKIYSTSHCVGENYQKNKAWLQRSCHYHFFCFDTEKKDFAVVRNPLEQNMMKYLPKRPLMDVSQSYTQHLHNNTVSMGGELKLS